MSLSNLLSYTGEVYKSFYCDEFIASFTHGTLATGQVDPVQACRMVEQLNAHVTRIAAPIAFNQEMVSGTQIEGGSCSSITFRIIKEGLAALKTLETTHYLKRSTRERCFASRFANTVKELEKTATGNRAADKAVQIAIRTEQMALNTITVDRVKIHSGNAVAEKVGAMALYYGLKVVKSSPELRVKNNDQLDSQLRCLMRNLEEGFYFLRIIQEKNNHKLEEKGHSAIYIKSGDAEYYFDPALGFFHLFFESIKMHLITNALFSANDRFGVDVLSFHRLEESNAL